MSLRATRAAGAAVLALALAGAGPAAADRHAADCAVETVWRDGAYRGVAVGYVAAGPSDVVSVSCVFEVHGEPAAATPVATGTGAAVTYAPLEVAAGAFDPVRHCVVTTVNGDAERWCYDDIEVPPREFYDLADELWPLLVDWHTWCRVFASGAGYYGPVTVEADGDLKVGGEAQWDCPPYDVWPPG